MTSAADKARWSARIESSTEAAGASRPDTGSRDTPTHSHGAEGVPPSLLEENDTWADQLPLSPRECEIVWLVARDFGNKRIAAALGISVWTVSTHIRRVFAKLGVHSKAGMVAMVLDRVAMKRTQSDVAPKANDAADPVGDAVH